MNKNDRKELEYAQDLLRKSIETISQVKEREEEKFDNLSDGLQATEKGVRLEENASNLDDVIYQIEDIISQIEDVIN